MSIYISSRTITIILLCLTLVFNVDSKWIGVFRTVEATPTTTNSQITTTWNTISSFDRHSISSTWNSSQNNNLLSLPGDDKDDYVHPIFICFFVFYFFGFSLVFCYALHLLGSKFGKWYKNYRTKRKYLHGTMIRNRTHSNQSGGRGDIVTPFKVTSVVESHTGNSNAIHSSQNHHIVNNYLYPMNHPSNHILQNLFYVQIIPYFLIRFLIYFLIGFELIPKDYFDIENHWAQSQIFLVAFSLSGILLHNSYFLIAFFWSELESFKRGIPTRQKKPLLIFITCSLIWFGAEIAMAVLVFVKCYPNLYSPPSNTVWFTWIVRVEHVLNAILSLALMIWFIIYSTWKKRSMWNLNFDEGLKYLRTRYSRRHRDDDLRKKMTSKTSRNIVNSNNTISNNNNNNNNTTISNNNNNNTTMTTTTTMVPVDETSILIPKSNSNSNNNTIHEYPFQQQENSCHHTSQPSSLPPSTPLKPFSMVNHGRETPHNDQSQQQQQQLLASQHSNSTSQYTYLYHNNNNNNTTRGPHLITRIEKTKKWLYRSMIVCILVYLLQSLSQLIFTEIFIAYHSNDNETTNGGVLILYNSYIIVIGLINSLSDFTPFLMCYIFHKSNEIVKDIVRQDMNSSGGGGGNYDVMTHESSYNILTGDGYYLNSQQVSTDDATSLREETEDDDELPIPIMMMQPQQMNTIYGSSNHDTTITITTTTTTHHLISNQQQQHDHPSQLALLPRQEYISHLQDSSQLLLRKTSVTSTPCSTTTDMSMTITPQHLMTDGMVQHTQVHTSQNFFSKLFKKWRSDDEMLVQVPYKD